VSGGDRGVARGAGLVLGGHHDVAGPRGEAAEALGGIEVGRLALGDEPLLRRLLGDAHAPADLRPRCTGPPGPVDEVADEVVGHLAEVVGREDGVRELVEGVRVDLRDGVDQVVEPDRVGHAHGISHIVNLELTGPVVNRRLTPQRYGIR
jgi:hypothetical protein